jgi:hypothetical protein
MLEQKIAALTDAVEKLTAVIEAQSNTPTSNDDASTLTPTPKPGDQTLTQKTPNAQDLKDATLKAARSGHKDAIRDKLAGFGVTKIQDLDAGNAVAFYGWVTSLGADQ